MVEVRIFYPQLILNHITMCFLSGFRKRIQSLLYNVLVFLPCWAWEGRSNNSDQGTKKLVNTVYHVHNHVCEYLFYGIRESYRNAMSYSIMVSRVAVNKYKQSFFCIALSLPIETKKGSIFGICKQSSKLAVVSLFIWMIFVLYTLYINTFYF